MLQILQQELVDISALKAGDSWREKGERSAGYLKRIHQTRAATQYMSSLQSPGFDGRSTPPAVATRNSSAGGILREPGSNIVATTDDSATVDPGAFGDTGDSGGARDSGDFGGYGSDGGTDGSGGDGGSDATDEVASASASGDSGGADELNVGIDHPRTSDQIEDMKTFAWQYYTNLYKADQVPSEAIEAYLDTISFDRVLTEEEQVRLTSPITMSDLVEHANRSVKATAPGNDGLSYPFLSLLYQMPKLQSLVLQVYNDALTGIFPTSWHDLRIRLLPKKGLLTLLKNWRPICLLSCDGKVFTRILTQRMAPILGRIINPFQSGFLQKRFICDNGLALSMVLEQAQCYSHTGSGILLDQEKAYDRERGIRQGDPLSPLLFNLALEPFLLSIIQDSEFQGYNVKDALHPPPPVLDSSLPAIKCLAYADDVCVLMKDEQDLNRLRFHMGRYAAVSNAKFNEDKSEAFSLNGRRSAFWQASFTAMQVHTYHHQGSGAAFRYLGLYFAYNTTQRAQTEEMLLTSVKKQCQIYSQRQLSIMGKVTVANSLILSKIWYSLRLLKPTKRFLANIKKCLYQFVWNKKTPLLRKDKLFLPRTSGGLAVLDPSIQQLVLQKRWLNYLVNPTQFPSFLYPYMLNHLSLLPASSQFPYLVFIDIHFRKAPLLNKDLSIWHSIFALYDFFGCSGFRFLDAMPLSILLQLSLNKLVIGLPEQHWLLRHSKFPCHQFFIFDEVQQRLRLRVAHEFHRFARLCRHLYNDILVHRTIQLIPCLWPHILHPPVSTVSAGAMSPLITYVSKTTAWTTFSPAIFRSHCQKVIRIEQNFHPSTVKLLWSTPMHPAARTVLYRAVSKCVPHKSYLATFGSVTNNICSFCGAGVDSLRHFIVDCPVKWSLWKDVLSRYYQNYPLTQEFIYGTIRFLHIPRFIKDKTKYMAVISTIFWQMWNLYWLHGNQNPNALPSMAITHFHTRTGCHIDRLLPSDS